MSKFDKIFGMLIIEPCPFCGGEGDHFSRYDSDENRPDGEQYFIQCKSCCAKSNEFYAETTYESNLGKELVREQRANIEKAKHNAIIAWNIRVK